MLDSERLDLPSASATYYLECSGSANLIRELRAKNALAPISETTDAKSGTEMHEAWAANPGHHNGLDRSQQRTLEALRRFEDMVVCNWCEPGETCHLLGREQRLWLHKGILPIFSGQYDAAYLSTKNRLLIVDGKTLYGNVTPAPDNLQMRSLVALFRSNYPEITETTVAIIAPNQEERVSMASYDDYEAEVALRYLRFLLDRANNPHAPRLAGPWCQYCPARLQCPEAQGSMLATTSLAQDIVDGKLQLPQGERGAQLLDQLKLAQTLVSTALDSYKTVLETYPDSIPGWKLKPGKKVRRIQEFSDTLKHWRSTGLDENAFYGASSVSVSLLESEYGRLKDLKGRALFDRFNEVMAEHLTWKQYAPELSRSQPQLPEK